MRGEKKYNEANSENEQTTKKIGGYRKWKLKIGAMKIIHPLMKK